MKEPYVIEFVSMREIRRSIDITEAFQLRKDRPAPWIQKACLFILRKLRAFYIGESVTIERHLIDGETFAQRLFKQRREISKCFDIKPTRLLIGAEDYAEIMHEKAANRSFSFEADYGYGNKIYGLTVEVIPWMRGILVMPSEK